MLITDTNLTIKEANNENNFVVLNSVGCSITQPDKSVTSYTPLQGNTIFQFISNGNYQVNIGAILYVPTTQVQPLTKLTTTQILTNIATSQLVGARIKQLVNIELAKIGNFNQYGEIVRDLNLPGFQNQPPPDRFAPKRFIVPIELINQLLNVINVYNEVIIVNEIINSLGINKGIIAEGVTIDFPPGSTNTIAASFTFKQSLEDDIEINNTTP